MRRWNPPKLTMLEYRCLLMFWVLVGLGASYSAASGELNMGLAAAIPLGGITLSTALDPRYARTSWRNGLISRRPATP